jgi:hypothetical protein
MAADLNQQMRTVLMQLALVSNGSTATIDADRGGGSARHYEHAVLAGTLRGAEPHKHFQRLYNAAATRAEREVVLDQAREVLSEILHSPPPPTSFETLEEKRAWIVKHCEGLTTQEAAIRAYTGVLTVYKARVDAGREPDRGRETNAVRYDSIAERRARVRELAEQDMSAKSIAKYLGLSYNTVRRDLGKRA